MGSRFAHLPLLNSTFWLEQLSSQNIQKAKIGPFEIEESKQPYAESIKLLLTSWVSEDELNYLQQLDANGDSRSETPGQDKKMD